MAGEPCNSEIASIFSRRILYNPGLSDALPRPNAHAEFGGRILDPAGSLPSEASCAGAPERLPEIRPVDRIARSGRRTLAIGSPFPACPEKKASGFRRLMTENPKAFSFCRPVMPIDFLRNIRLKKDKNRPA
jgi:hypothetical protein